MSYSNGDIELKVKEIVEKYKDDIIMLDALYQIGLNPTSKTAGYALESNYHYILQNLMLTHDLSENKAKEYINQLKEEMNTFFKECFHKNNECGYIVEEKLKKTIEECCIDKLLSLILEKEILQKKEILQFLAILFYGNNKNRNISLPTIFAKYTACSASIPGNINLFIDELIKAGIIKRLYWVSAGKNRNSEVKLIVPPYVFYLRGRINLKEILESFKIPLDEVKERIFSLIRNRNWRQLYNIEYLLNKADDGYVSGFIPFSNVNILRNILGSYKDYKWVKYFALNPFIIEEIKRTIYQVKNDEIKQLKKLIANHLEKLRQKYAGVFDYYNEFENSFIVQFSQNDNYQEARLWFSPWISPEMVEEMRKNYSVPSFVVISGDVTIPIIKKMLDEVRLINYPSIFLLLKFKKTVSFIDDPTQNELIKLLTTEFSELLFQDSKLLSDEKSYTSTNLTNSKNILKEKIEKSTQNSSVSNSTSNQRSYSDTKILDEHHVSQKSKEEYQQSKNDENIYSFNSLRDVGFKVGKIMNNIEEDLYFYPFLEELMENLNIGILGDMGTGKTQFLKYLVSTWYKKSKELNYIVPPFGILIFDYKGGYEEEKFVRLIDANVIDLNKMSIPINLLELNPTAKKPIFSRAESLVSIVSAIYSIGPKQKNRLRKAVIAAFNNKGLFDEMVEKDDMSLFDKNRWPTIYDVYQVLLEDELDDSLTAILDSIVGYDIFERDSQKCVLLKDFLKTNNVIFLKNLGDKEDLKSLVISVIFNLLYDTMLTGIQPGRKIVSIEGKEYRFRKTNLLVVVDESHNLMRNSFPFLENLLKEGREFGFGFLFASQYPSHFKNKTDYFKYFQTWFIHRLGVSSKELKNYFNKEVVEKSKMLASGKKNEGEAIFYGKTEQGHSTLNVKLEWFFRNY